MNSQEIQQHLQSLEKWDLAADEKSISREFKLNDDLAALSFANAVAWTAHRQDHHPDLHLCYNTCSVSYTTHSEGGLTEKDFAGAKAVEQIFSP